MDGGASNGENLRPPMATDAPSDSLPTFRWSPADDLGARDARGRAVAGSPFGGLLTDELAPLAEDRGAGADDVARRIARAAHGWLAEASPESLALGTRDDAACTWHAALESELAAVFASHAWRGPVAGLRAALAGVARGAFGDERAALLEECALWCEDRTDEEGDTPWDGAPLAPGVRLPDRGRVATPFLTGPEGLERGEVVVVHGWSETVARALEAAHRAGLAPEAIVTEGGPDLGGRRLARRLSAAGLPVRFVYDAAAADCVRRADRVWLGTDAIGARGFVARIGTRVMLQEARRAEVRVAVLATSDKLVPGGELALPRWCEDEPWLLWERPPRGVVIASQAYEAVPLELAGVFATEFGLCGAAELSVRALRTASA